ncbi:uncharacterized protein K02A2.6-like [Eupeodes corollae]|uniref:uncharacterized protein K02A2.6-like n=1 Tax=Eupeodes corollae TaxID=290404 RepID=UPI00249096E9|nr:uncharacterized protein K02A2.6-like [Eupeodes corollae]
MAQQYTLDKFDCEGDGSSVAIRWERWKRGLGIYLEAASIVTEVKKRASLLHFGGPELQEIFYNLVDANVEPNEENEGNVFRIAIEKLDEYFAPKQCLAFERHMFRSIKQEPNEKFQKFLVRLRQQAGKCAFADINENLISQVVEKCSSVALRKKILKSGDSMTLDEIKVEANIIEAVECQLEEFGTKTEIQTVNRIENGLNKGNKKGCSRCGSFKHYGRDKDCPARNKECLRCGIMGHFRRQCRTKHGNKRKQEIPDTGQHSSKPKRFKATNNVVDMDRVQGNSNNYIFNIDGDATVTCRVGNIGIEMLIDSGCNQNLITDKTWELLKRKQVHVTSQNTKPNKNFLAYGSEKPLKLLGSFDAAIEFAGKSVNTTFYVVANGTRDLLGRITATSLGILRINIGINQVKEKGFPKFKDVLVEIPIDDSVKPISQPYRRIPIPLEDKVDAKIKDLLNKDIIEEVLEPSNWVSPIVPVLKDNGDVRICVDMRRANTAIKRENHPLPTMNELLPKVCDAKVFSKLDIKDAFHQIELHPNSRHITTFITSKGLFRYKRMMFGITCAPEIFQKLLERILLKCDGVMNFIDDILVYGKDETEHHERLNNVKEVLQQNNVVLCEEKCVYGLKKVQFLGHELSGEGVRPLEKYISAVKEFREPTTIAELQSFLGLINFIGKWIPHLATLSEPLKMLLRQKSKRNSDISENWGKSQQTAFDSLKDALVDVPQLGYYNPHDKTLVIADASPVGLGAVLVQIKEKGPRIIAFGNKTLSDCERRYCQTEKEALALVWACEHFDMFLYGKDFVLITDHKPLETIFGPKTKSCARIERWVLRLQSYRYKVKYSPDKDNVAGPLSRLCRLATNPSTIYESYVHSVVEHSRPTAVSLQEIEECSKQDSEIQKVKEGLYSESWDEAVKSYKIFQNELCFYGDILLRGSKIVIPSKLRDRVLKAAHEGHPGIVAMKSRLRTKIWWPKCDKDSENLCKACKGCTLVSAPNPPNPLKRRELPTEPWIDVAIDLMGPQPSNDYIFVIVDYYSRYKEVKISRTITSSVIIVLLKEIFSRLGNPVSITSDNGKQFISAELNEFCKEQNIRIYHTIPYFPQQNGEVERQNRDILKRLKISQAEKKDWKEALREYMIMYNSTPHTVTGKTPSELFFSRQFRDKLPMMRNITYNPRDEDIRDRDRECKEKGKEYADRKSLNFEPTSHTIVSNNNGDIEIRNDETGNKIRRNVVHLKKVEGQWKALDTESTEDGDVVREHSESSDKSN